MLLWKSTQKIWKHQVYLTQALTQKPSDDNRPVLGLLGRIPCFCEPQGTVWQAHETGAPIVAVCKHRASYFAGSKGFRTCCREPTNKRYWAELWDIITVQRRWRNEDTLRICILPIILLRLSRWSDCTESCRSCGHHVEAARLTRAREGL